MRKLTILALACLTVLALACIAGPAFADAPAPQVATRPDAPAPLPDLAQTLADDASGACAAPQSNVESTPAQAADPAADPAADTTPEPLFLGGQQCGAVVCPKLQYCCNPTCNLCLPYGISCTLETCT